MKVNQPITLEGDRIVLKTYSYGTNAGNILTEDGIEFK